MDGLVSDTADDYFESLLQIAEKIFKSKIEARPVNAAGLYYIASQH